MPNQRKGAGPTSAWADFSDKFLNTYFYTMKYVLTLLLFCSGLTLFAQVDATTPPYKKFPQLPPLQLLLGDSTTKYVKDDLPKKKKVLVMLFSPDCSHCQQEAEAMVQRRKELKDIQVVMVTMHPLHQMNAFAEKYDLRELKNIVIGRDMYMTLPSFYGIGHLPFHALYDRKGNLITAFEGSVALQKILDAFSER